MFLVWFFLIVLFGTMYWWKEFQVHCAVSEEERGHACTLSVEGHSACQISKLMGKTEREIQRLISPSYRRTYTYMQFEAFRLWYYAPRPEESRITFIASVRSGMVLFYLVFILVAFSSLPWSSLLFPGALPFYIREWYLLVIWCVRFGLTAAVIWQLYVFGDRLVEFEISWWLDDVEPQEEEA